MVKKLIGLVIASVLVLAGYGQTGFSIEKDPLSKKDMLVGVIHKKDIVENPAFKWYAESVKEYPRPDPDAVKALRDHKDKLFFMIFGGTWCPDTHYILPKFFKIQEEAGFPEDHIALFALDHSKKMQYPVADVMDVVSVPTIIVMKNGKEMGRVVEYGESGYWDRELAEIIDNAFGEKVE